MLVVVAVVASRTRAILIGGGGGAGGGGADEMSVDVRLESTVARQRLVEQTQAEDAHVVLAHVALGHVSLVHVERYLLRLDGHLTLGTLVDERVVARRRLWLSFDKHGHIVIVVRYERRLTFLWLHLLLLVRSKSRLWCGIV